ncbi:hypothetical protein FNV43_RR25482 [Rhamnella rubrinervis]|uniref:3-oxo-5-alpha-steroid 4-dehydrogenase C-terminal domain-containing protein n=1 Tax=Rhamnella rubrinervis TaxID=2594499 RepID=A0A8K0GQ50_9ROSA|nr:hypothetical protein FNV43_RR25482 [Rhamnella rubrinervis]
MALSMLLGFIFPPPPSLFINTMSVITVTSLAFSGLSEIRGNHLQYSKFWDVNPPKSSSPTNRTIKLSSRAGMLFLYTPAFLAALSSFLLFPNGDVRLLLLNLALTLHFFKRDFEVLLVHRYSGGMVLDSAIVISLSYFSSTISMIYAQHLAQGLPDPPIDLKYPGAVLFLIGICGNFYHHYLLSKLRKNGDKGYKIPKGTIFYLIGRSYATRRWYLSKFEDFPKHVKALIPYVF